MKIIISGHRGFVGSALTDALAPDHYIWGIDNGQNAVVEESSAHATTTSNLCDVDIPGSVECCDIIIHCASPVGAANMRPEKEVAWQIVRDTRHVLNAAIKLKAKLLLFSTSEVYAYQVGDNGIRAQYALGKLTSEAMALGSSHPNVHIIRPFNIVGSRQKAQGGFVLARFIEQAKQGKPLTVFGGGQQRRCFTHISDLVSFVMALIKAWPAEKRTWNVANPDNYVTIQELARKVILQHGGSIAYDCDAQKALGNPHWEESPERPQHTSYHSWFWSPKVGLDEIIREMLAGEEKPHARAAGQSVIPISR